MSQSAAAKTVAVDVTALVQLDQTVLDALPIGVYVCDSEGRIARVNRKAVELWGRKPALFDQAQRFCGCFSRRKPERRFHAAGSHADGACGPPWRQFPESWRPGVVNPDGRRWVASVTIEPRRRPGGCVIGAINCFQDVTREFEQREMLARRQKSFDLAMVASRMGTWRYTMADNVCLYDENAQRLYGLTEERFLHDENGVKR